MKKSVFSSPASSLVVIVVLLFFVVNHYSTDAAATAGISLDRAERGIVMITCQVNTCPADHTCYQEVECTHGGGNNGGENCETTCEPRRRQHNKGTAATTDVSGAATATAEE